MREALELAWLWVAACASPPGAGLCMVTHVGWGHHLSSTVPLGSRNESRSRRRGGRRQASFHLGAANLRAPAVLQRAHPLLSELWAW